MIPENARRFTFGLLIAGAVAGCGRADQDGTLWGYSTGRPFRQDIDSVYVEMFTTHEFRRDLEYRLSEAVAKRIELDTPYRIAGRERADTLLSGEVLAVRQATLGDDFRTDLPRETAATYVVTFRWQDLRTGKVLVERERFPFTTTYIRPIGETFFDSTVRGMDGLAETMVESMESSW